MKLTHMSHPEVSDPGCDKRYEAAAILQRLLHKLDSFCSKCEARFAYGGGHNCWLSSKAIYVQGLSGSRVLLCSYNMD